MSIDEHEVEQFVGQVIDDVGATVSGALTHIGLRLGLYRAMAGAGPLTPADLAERTDTTERYVREWLNNQAAGGYVHHDAGTGTYELPAEHAFVLANPDSPVHMAPAWDQLAAVWAVQDTLEAAFRSGDGVSWGDQDPRFVEGAARFFEPAYRANLVGEWIPALPGVRQRLEAGGRIADVGCGHGTSAVLMAEAFPDATVTGFDIHTPSIEAARRRADRAGLDDDRVRFEVAAAREFPAVEDGYDLVCFFDSLHDFGDPVGAAAHAGDVLAADGAVMVVEVNAHDRVEDNLNPLGRLGYGMSTVACIPNALSQEGGHALGGQAGPTAIGEVMQRAGFTRFRTVARAQVHQVMEARP